MGTRVDQGMPSKIQSRPIILLTITKFKLSNAYKISMVTTTRFCTKATQAMGSEMIYRLQNFDSLLVLSKTGFISTKTNLNQLAW